MKPAPPLCLLILSLLALLTACGGGSGPQTSAAMPQATMDMPMETVANPLDAIASDPALVAAAEAAADAANAHALADPPAPVATATLTALRYTDANNWYVRTLEASAADNVPDAGGLLRYYEVHRQSASPSFSSNGVVQAWGYANTQAREGDTHWNGSAWVACTLGTRGTASVRDSQGRHVYAYCDKYEEGTGLRRIVDISGQRLTDVVRDYIRTFPGDSAGVTFATWGPANLALYGSATFPAGSALHYQINTVTRTAHAYDVQASNVVSVYTAAVAAGGDARANPGLACNGNSAAIAAALGQAGTLETLVARSGGKPCLYNPGGSAPDVTGATNEWWGNSTLSLGDLANTNTLPPGTGNYYNTAARLRVAFAAAGNGATFYNCYRRSSDGSPRNCSIIGLGTWSIQVLGDARVLAFSVAPALAQRLGYARTFVERGGKVYYGWKNPENVINPDVRLNMPAANAVLRQLGLPVIQPVTKPGTATGDRAAALATLKGAWGGADPDGTHATIFRFGDDGRFFMAEAKPYLPATREQTGAELGWIDYDPVSKQVGTLVQTDSNLTSGTSNPSLAESQAPFIITPALITGGSGSDSFAIPRLENDPQGLVGLWAVNSPTDLSTVHLAFFSNGRVMVISHKKGQGGATCTSSGQDAPGAEFASWSYNAANRALRIFGRIYDTDGCQGAFDGSPAAVAAGHDNLDSISTVTFAADGQSMVLDDGGGPETWYRIAPQ